MTLIPNNYLARLVGSDTIAAMSASASLTRRGSPRKPSRRLPP